ncbi:NAD(P)-dependent oxidoreductase [Clostridium sp. AWRP]|uniref:NAD-dependent epimerase/dehydratase family protein n=1 Tax=Clostridium sp. AWRP TaxID=2212991 RepID=UPI000FDCBA00|nr:NAD(P)-dependent oxidoreductase [Clostridium sp. AWRP]AZV55530.1 NAD(P)-dependent oxidoreductase [Clostridium sp. AWRP]
MDRILQEDFETIANSNIEFEQFKNKTFMITGATGLVGSLLVRALMYCDHKYSLNLQIIAVIRNQDKANSIYGEDINNPRLFFTKCDLSREVLETDFKVNYLVHTAGITNSKMMVTNPVETITTAIIGTKTVLDFAVSNGVESVVYLSSMEVYGDAGTTKRVTENELGYIDINQVRSCYSESKRMCECMCTAYSAQYGLNVKCARLAQTFGAGISKYENRVFAQFARSVIKGENIVLHTRGLSEGNYVYTSDAIKAILLLLGKGAHGQTYNVSNEENHTTIYEMAEMVASEIANSKIKVVYDIPEDRLLYGYAPDVKVFLSSEKMRELGWKPEVGLLESYKRLVAWIYENEFD